MRKGSLPSAAAFAMESREVMPAPPATPTTCAQSLSASYTKFPAGLLASMTSPAFTMSTRWEERMPAFFTVEMYTPPSASLGEDARV